MEKLYTARAIAKKVDGYENVPFHYFVSHRGEPPIPYEEAIDFETIGREVGFKNMYTEGFVDECFIWSEIEELKKYLATHTEITNFEVKEVELPIKDPMAGWGSLAAGGGADFYMMAKEDGYNLSVPIWAYYCFDECEPEKEEIAKTNKTDREDEILQELGYDIRKARKEKWQSLRDKVANDNLDDEELREAAIEHTAKKPLRKFMQMDIFQNVNSDEVDEFHQADEDGDGVWLIHTLELRNTNELRISIPVGHDIPATIRGLKKAIAWLEESPETFTEPYLHAWGGYQ